MKISSALLSISAFAVCATVAAAFSMGPAQTRLTAHSGPTSRSHQTGAAKSLRMSSEDFAKSEIASNDVSCLLPNCWTTVRSVCSVGDLATNGSSFCRLLCFPRPTVPTARQPRSFSKVWVSISRYTNWTKWAAKVQTSRMLY